MNPINPSDIYLRGFEILLSATNLIGKSLEPEVAINGILELLSQHLQLNKARVVVPDINSGKLTIRYAHDLSDEEKSRGIYNIGEGVTGKVMSSGKIALIPDINSEPEFLGKVIDRDTLPLTNISYIAVPIFQQAIPVGVLAIHCADSLDRDIYFDLNILRIVAGMIGNILLINELVSEKTVELLNENTKLKNALEHAKKTYGILGESSVLKDSLTQAKQAAKSDAAVMLMGESGTGKERFARMIHFDSERRHQPFVCINCAAIPDNLLESELFGHEKGSFTGATTTKPGKFELTNNGTLFLDEIGDMNLELQSKLLRVLQEKSVQRVGGLKEIPVDVRIITATHRQLRESVNEGTFRLDLYYRLNVIPIFLPPLRERSGDVRLLTSYFLNRANQLHRKNIIFTADALEKLELYDWPGNIRQLENLIERMVIMTQNSFIAGNDIEPILLEESKVNIANGNTKPAPDYHANNNFTGRPYMRINEIDRSTIEKALRECKGNKTQAAQQLGLTARQLHYRLSKLQIEEETT